MAEFKRRLTFVTEHPELRRVLKYMLVGVASVVINYLAYLLCLNLGFGYFFAAVLGYVTGLLNSFALGHTIVFRPHPDAPPRPIIVTFFTFLTVYSVGGMAMGLGVEYGVETLGFPANGTWLAIAAVVVVWNYIGSKFIVFKGAH